MPEKLQKLLLDKKHKAEQKAADESFKAATASSERVFKKLLGRLDRDELAAKKANEAEATEVKRAANEKSRKFTVAQILIELGKEVAGYFSHGASIASLGIVGAAKAAFAVARAGLAPGIRPRR